MHRLISGVAGLLALSVVVGAQQTQTPAAHPALPADGQRVLGTSIQGRVLNATNKPLPDMTVRLRDIRFGHIVVTATTDRVGAFAFGSLQPGSYIVELMGSDQTVLATSEILNVETGDSRSTIIKLPLDRSAVAGVWRATPALIAVATAAAASGVLAATSTGQPISPVR